MRWNHVVAVSMLLGWPGAVQADSCGCLGTAGCAADGGSPAVCLGCQEISACGPCAGSPCCGGGVGQPVCSACGGGSCWDCTWDEGIDVDSLTPEAQSKQLWLASQARIKVELPDDASVHLLGQRMSTLGEKRSFVVPIPDQAKAYKYEIRVDVVRGGKKYYKKLRIDEFRAGTILAVKVAAPPVPDGEPGQIVIESTPEAAGGKPADLEDGEGDDDAAPAPGV